jgi:urea transporter
VIAAWIVIYCIKFLHLGSLATSSPLTASSFHFVPAVTTGFGQVMFQNNIITGLIFLFAIFVNSRTVALYALYGSLLGGMFALLLSLPLAAINMGIFGYNGVLCGIALGEKKRNAFFLASIAVVLSVVLCQGFITMNILALTAPFVLATWAALLIKKVFHKDQNTAS